MAAVVPPADQTADLLQKLSLDAQSKTLEISEPTKKSSVDTANMANGQIQSDRSITPVLPTDFMDPNAFYLPPGYPSTTYYYNGYDGTTNEWEDYSRYMNLDGVEVPPGVYGDNGSMMYHHGYGYAPYGSYSPAGATVPTVGHDGQLYGAQQYQYPSPFFQPMTPTSGPYPTAPAKGEISTSVAADQGPLSVDSANRNSNVVSGAAVNGNTRSAPVRSGYQSSSFNTNASYTRGAFPGGSAASVYHDPRFGYDGLRTPVPWLDGPMFSEGQARPVSSGSAISSMSNANGISSSKNQNVRPQTTGLHYPRSLSGSNSSNGYMNRMYPDKLYGQYGSTFRSSLGFGSNVYVPRTNARGWPAVDGKFKSGGRGGFYNYGNDNMDGLNELNRGPRAKGSKIQKGFAPVALAIKGQSIPLAVTNDSEKDKLDVNPNTEQYNQTDFSDSYADAKFFVIKSYSEDDVHKSIKYNVWASTPNGNKKLDAAYQEAQQKSAACPVFLFFSVNTSGQFVGVAEMVGPVDFDKNVEYWQQDKWIGCFPVKWHIVKDVPNSLLKHITLENNENKSVTNSRDTQEVKMVQGHQMLKIFKDHSSKQCILDDFDFYEDRQKRIQEKKAKQQHFQKQLWESKPAEQKNKDNEELKSDEPSEDSSGLIKEAFATVQTNKDINLPENGSVAKSADLTKGTEPIAVIDVKIVGNGVANSC